MPRPVSWLPRLHEIRRSVANSVRSHYDRRDLQKLFQLQPRAALALMETMPTVTIGRSNLVEREALSKFLDRIHRAENVTEAVKTHRAEREAAIKRKPRALVRRDQDVVPAATLKSWLIRGHLHVRFETAQELFDALWRVAASVESDLETFIALYEPIKASPPDQARQDVDALFAELDRLEAAARRKEGAA